MDLVFITWKNLLILISLLIFFFIKNAYIFFLVTKQNTENIKVENNTIEFSSLTLRQKLAQMIIVRADILNNKPSINLGVGGFHLDQMIIKNLDYKKIISEYKNLSNISPFFVTDMEGAWNPFNDTLFPKFSEINSPEEAYLAGLEEGKLLKKVGFNLNFAPVAEYIDKAYSGRAFNGTKKEVKEKLAAYIQGLQKNIKGTCKHYPGSSMFKNLHLGGDAQEITTEDLELFDVCFKNNISAVMIGQQKVRGVIDSNGKPATVSKEVISTLDNFEGLIISDEINMLGLRTNYLTKTNMYVDLINSGNNVILDYYQNPISLYLRLDKLEKKVKEGEISIDNIDESVRKILKTKGYKVK